MAEAIEVLKQQGAIDRRSRRHPERRRHGSDEQLPAVGHLRRRRRRARASDADCSIVFKYGMKRDFNAWLASLGASGAGEDADRAARSGTSRTRSAGAIKYGQAQLDISDEMDLETRPRALRGRPREGHPARGDARHRRGDEGAASSTRCSSPARAAPRIAARPGYPTVIVPFAHGAERADAAVSRRASTRSRRPFGVSFTGMACSEPRLIELAYAFEQATKRRVPPPLFP